MRGGAQAHLLKCDGGLHYVVKFSNNPQGGRRILLNEIILSVLMKRLGILTPEIAVVNVDSDFIKANPEVLLSWGPNQKFAPDVGPHFGSLHVGGALPATVFDFLPDTILPEVVNREHFFGALAFDKWVSNADSCQVVFHRARIKTKRLGCPSVGWLAQFIDRGLAFQGRHWTFHDSPIQGIYGRRIVYGPKPLLHDFDFWVNAIEEIHQNLFLERVFALLPHAWIEGQEGELQRVLDRLQGRSKRIPELMAGTVKCLQAMPERRVPYPSRCA